MRKHLRIMVEQVADGTYRPSQETQNTAPPPALPAHRPGPDENPFPDTPLPSWLPMQEPPVDRRLK